MAIVQVHTTLNQLQFLNVVNNPAIVGIERQHKSEDPFDPNVFRVKVYREGRELEQFIIELNVDCGCRAVVVGYEQN